MQKLISKRLEEMRSITDRTVLKDALNEIFFELYNETERKYSALEERIRNELKLNYESYSVYSTVLHRDEVEEGHPYLSPMIPAEMESIITKTDDLITALSDNSEPIIGTVFYEADYMKCLQPDFKGRVFDGSIELDSKSYNFKCRLRPATRYMALVESLYNIFIQNGVPWRTINCAYLNKFFDVCIMSIDEELPPKVNIAREQIDISLGEGNKFIHMNMIPVWNIDKHRVSGDDFAMPTIDYINYEYHFETEKLGSENGFLVDYESAYIQSIRREKDTVVAVSSEAYELDWDLYRFRPRHDRPVDSYRYPILSNARKDSFSARLTDAYGIQVRSKAELRKLVGSYETAKDIILDTITMTSDKVTEETYSMNKFIIDELRDPKYQRTMVLGFVSKSADFVTQDIISFMTTQIQAIFPEYNCVGKLI